MPPRQVRAETDLCRAPGLWAVGPVQLELPLDVKGINGTVRASGSLKLTPDLDVFAWACERWLSTPPLDLDGIARFTLYDLGLALYGVEPSGKHRQDIRASLRRLHGVQVELIGYDALEGKAATGGTLEHLFNAIVSDGRLVERDARTVGALRGSTFKVQLAPWLRERLVAGAFTYLDFATLRKLDGLAKRVWVYLAAERYTRTGEGRRATWVGLGTPALASLGADTYKRHRDARRALARAGRRIVEADPRYESVTVERRPGGYALVAQRLDAKPRKERETVAEAITESLRIAA